MASELNGVGAGYAQGVSYPSPSLPEKADGVGSSVPASTLRVSAESEVQINGAKRSFPALSDSKDAAAQAAKSVRNADNALGKADTLLTEMKSQVSLVKNYPPFPAGNEDRVKYLNGIDGLRKQLQSLVIPPAASSIAPVFYPQEEKFPPLDAKTPSDAAVLAFGDAVAAVRVNLNAGRAVLQAQAEQLSSGANAQLPQAPTESQAQGISVKVAGQLAGTTQSLAGNTDAFAQL